MVFSRDEKFVCPVVLSSKFGAPSFLRSCSRYSKYRASKSREADWRAERHAQEPGHFKFGEDMERFVAKR